MSLMASGRALVSGEIHKEQLSFFDGRGCVSGKLRLVGSLEVADVCIYMHMVRVGRQRRKIRKWS